MKKKMPYILLVIILIAVAATVINGMNSKKAREAENAEYARSVTAEKDSGTLQNTERTYEYFQTDPDSGLAVIYTFTVGEEKDGKRVGSITIDSAEKKAVLLCAVRTNEEATTFLFAEYLDGDGSMGNFSQGDELVVLHNAEKGVIPQFVKLPQVFDGEEIIRNY